MKEEQSPRFESVMIIDDNLIDLYISSRMITKNNFGKKVLQYSSAIEALKYLQENQDNISQLPEVIFVDIYMPGMSGFEFMKEYDKLSTPLKNICRVFIISSSLDEQDLNCANNDENIVAMKEKPITKEFLTDLKIN
jgi:CheY-like chemotaxis protein